METCPLHEFYRRLRKKKVLYRGQVYVNGSPELHAEIDRVCAELHERLKTKGHEAT